MPDSGYPWKITDTPVPGQDMNSQAGRETTSPTLLMRVRDPRDEAAWREFVARYSELIWRYCLRRGLREADAEDVRQLVWLDLARGLRNFEYDTARGRFRKYLARVVQSAISRHFARKNPADRQLDSGVLASAPEDDSGFAQLWEEEWVDHHYRLAFATVEETFEPRSIAVFRRVMDGVPTAEITQELGLSSGAVHQINRRIRTRMKELITLQIREEDEPGYAAP